MNAISQRRQRITEPRPQTRSTKKFMKLSRVGFELCERTDRHTDILPTLLDGCNAHYLARHLAYRCVPAQATGEHVRSHSDSKRNSTDLGYSIPKRSTAATPLVPGCATVDNGEYNACRPHVCYARIETVRRRMAECL